jgi:prepilin-type N-terminal cleavage/methylation domain-containing protein
MKKKGFTLVELLVVIAIIALLMGILMPALARVRQIAYRLYCGTNLSGIGKAMLIYANDYDDELPKGGLANSGYVAKIANWQAVPRATAFASGGNMSCNFYMLVKYAEVTPKSFLCKGDSGVTEFKPSTYGLTGVELVDLWDFGNNPQEHCSYSYHNPYGQYGLTTSSEPGMGVAGDPNPWQASNGAAPKDGTYWTRFTGGSDRESVKAGNAQTHQEDAQNILFMDGHTSAEKTSRCGVDDDNVYTSWTAAGATGAGKTNGKFPVALGENPRDRTDTVLLTDGGASSTGGTGGTGGR